MEALETDRTAIWERVEKYLRVPPQIALEWNDSLSPARGWLIINSLKGGAAGGGTRMRAGLNRDEVTFLAKAMELKFALAGPPIGGAKSGIDFDPADPRKGEVLERWFRAIRTELSTRYGTAGDLNVSESEDVMPACRAIGIGHPQLGVLAGHFRLEGEALERRCDLMRSGLDMEVPPPYGLAGRPARVFSLVTGYSVAWSIQRLIERQDRKPAETRVLLQGFGAVGGAAALYLARAGFRIVGICDAEDALIEPAGMGPADIEQLLRDRDGNTLPGNERPGAADRRARFWDTPADAFVAAAASGMIDEDRLDLLERAGVKTIVSGANHPFWALHPGDTRVERMADERFAVIADVIAGCGTAHAFACQSASDVGLQPEAIFASIRRTVTDAMDESIRRGGSLDRGLLAGGLELALDRSSPAAE